MAKDKSKGPDGFLKSPIKSIGGKTGQTKLSTRSLIYKLEPPDIDFWFEPFAGSACITIGNPKVHKVEVVNDLNWYIINVFKQLQNNPDAFWNLFKVKYKNLLFHEEDYFQGLKKELILSGYNINKAVSTYLINKHCYNGIIRFNEKGECNSSWCQTVKGRGILNEEWYAKVLERIKDISFSNYDYKKILNLAKYHDSVRTFVVLDPPYVYKKKGREGGCVTTYNGVKFTDEDHLELFRQLEDLSCRWLLTIDKNEFIKELYKDYNIIDNKVFWCCSQTPAGRGIKDEYIITNYDIETFKLI